MKPGIVPVSVALLCAVLSAPAATTHYVDLNSTNPTPPYADWTTAATDIQAAIDAARDGDAVVVSDGTYRLFAQINVLKGIALRSLNGPARTVVDAQGWSRCMRVSHSNAVVDGFTLTGGDCADDDHAGGGLLVSPGAVVRSCVISSNYTWKGGGALVRGTLSRCTVSANSAVEGGGVYVIGGVVEDCVISSNWGGWGGGGAYVSNGVLTRSVMRGNRAIAAGGGVYLATAGRLEESVIEDNAVIEEPWTGTLRNSRHVGGGVLVQEGAEVNRCLVGRNIASYGGGVGLEGGRIRNSVIRHNVASVGGGGVAIGDGVSENNTIVENRSLRWAGGVWFTDLDLWHQPPPTQVVRNSVVYRNLAPENAEWGSFFEYGPYLPSGTTYSLSYCCSTEQLPGDHNIRADPVFVDAAAGDYALARGSPCNNAGLNAAWMTGATDYSGHPRISEGTVDIGACESDWRGGPLRCRLTADRAEGPAPHFTILRAHVAGGNTRGLYYRWDFDGDGQWDRKGPNLAMVIRVFPGTGARTVRLQVRNGAREIATDVRTNYVTTAPRVLYVSPRGAHAYPFASRRTAATNIQAAIDAAVAGCGVHVLEGRYVLTQPIVLAKGVTVRGVSGPARTVVDANGTGRCFYLGHDQAVINGLTLTGGDLVIPPADWHHGVWDGGGAVRINVGGIVRACRLTGNSCRGAWGGGGAALCYLGGILEQCTIDGNFSDAGSGGGVSVRLAGTVRDCVVSGNAAARADPRFSWGAWGGGVSLEGGGLVETSLIVSNAALLTSNAWAVGGGLSMDGGGSARRCVIWGNRAPGGGGAWLSKCGVFENCLVTGNRAESIYEEGGGIFVYELSEGIRNCTVAGNWAWSAGGVSSWSRTPVENCIIYDNSNDGRVGRPTLRHSCAPYASTYPPSAGNIVGPPAFVDPANGDYRLSAGSPCIDAGSTNSPNVDLDGVPRPLDGDGDGITAYDMGAYEFFE